MGPTQRNAADALMRHLQQHGTHFEYFQVLRLLRLVGVNIACAAAEPNLRTRAALELGMACGEVQAVRHLGRGRWRVTARCFGLYGSGSPLPTYYTEDLLDEQRDGRSAARGLIDILHHALYPLLFAAWEKYRLAQRISETGDVSALRCLHAFAGLAQTAAYRRWAQEPVAVLRYLPLLQQGPRSASGLQQVLELELRPATVRVIEHVRRLLSIPERQWTRVGECRNRLGHDVRLGHHLDDASGTIAVRVQNLGTEAFQSLLPGRPARRRMQGLVRLYLRDSVDVQLELQLRADARPPALRLGARKWSRIGLDAWLDRPAGHAPLARAGQWPAHAAAEPTP